MQPLSSNSPPLNPTPCTIKKGVLITLLVVSILAFMIIPFLGAYGKINQSVVIYSVLGQGMVLPPICVWLLIKTSHVKKVTSP